MRPRFKSTTPLTRPGARMQQNRRLLGPLGSRAAGVLWAWVSQVTAWGQRAGKGLQSQSRGHRSSKRWRTVLWAGHTSGLLEIIMIDRAVSMCAISSSSNKNQSQVLMIDVALSQHRGAYSPSREPKGALGAEERAFLGKKTSVNRLSWLSGISGRLSCPEGTVGTLGNDAYSPACCTLCNLGSPRVSELRERGLSVGEQEKNSLERRKGCWLHPRFLHILPFTIPTKPHEEGEPILCNMSGFVADRARTWLQTSWLYNQHSPPSPADLQSEPALWARPWSRLAQPGLLLYQCLDL